MEKGCPRPVNEKEAIKLRLQVDDNRSISGFADPICKYYGHCNDCILSGRLCEKNTKVSRKIMKDRLKKLDGK
jgi:hypothetical protein